MFVVRELIKTVLSKAVSAVWVYVAAGGLAAFYLARGWLLAWHSVPGYLLAILPLALAFFVWVAARGWCKERAVKRAAVYTEEILGGVRWLVRRHTPPDGLPAAEFPLCMRCGHELALEDKDGKIFALLAFFCPKCGYSVHTEDEFPDFADYRDFVSRELERRVRFEE